MLPFSREQFFAVFVAYNSTAWPAVVLSYALALVALSLLARPSRFGDRFLLGVLALMWFWTGLAYHWLHFAEINPAARLFGVAFIVEAGALSFAGVRSRSGFAVNTSARGILGLALILYAGVIYPLLGLATGHNVAELPMFGVTPCPVTIFTFGSLLLATGPLPWWVLPIPVLWSLIGVSAAFLLGVPQDWILLASGIVAVIALRDRLVRSC